MRSKPITRHDCTETPCPWVSCKYHILFDTVDISNLPTDNKLISILSTLPETCMLDVIDDNPNGMSLDSIADILCTTIDRLKRSGAIGKVRKVFKEMDDFEMY